MDLIAWLLRLLFFVLALWFALENTARVPLRVTSSLSWDSVPLIGVILVCLVAGALAGMLALVPTLLRQRRQLAAQTRAARVAATPGPDATDRLTQAARQMGAVGALEVDTRGEP
ncbi:MAG TPA: LapA family protein [Burkholderiaceae bacterium]